ncbi:uncharacterized protein [Musca autumnalis]|uniref:uncharacterized protein n=1 Tax=Musca autumnalis TaxID=221902 RepID=UPI003CEEDE92
MDASNMFGIDLVMQIDNHLEKADKKKRTTSEVVEELVKPISAVKLTESETESVTADPISMATIPESVTAGSIGVSSKSVTADLNKQNSTSESVTAGSSVPNSRAVNTDREPESITVGSAVASHVRTVERERTSVTAGDSYTPHRYSCRVCQRRHSLSACKEFLAMSLDSRFNVLAKHLDCTRCLGKWHQATYCHSNKVCYKCGGSHHVLLHDDRNDFGPGSKALFRPRPSSRSSPYPNSASRPSSNLESRSSEVSRTICPPYHSTLGVLSLQTVATLSPSLVALLTCVAQPFPVRAVLDPCSTQSTICSSMVDHLKFPTSNLDGFRLCRISIASVYDPSQTISFVARVADMSHVYTPKEAVPERLKEAFLGLPLADPHFFRPSRVALVLGPDVYAKVVTHRVQALPGLPIAQYTIFGWVLSGACYT